MKYAVTHTTKFKYSDTVPVCHNIVHLRPRELPHQRCDSFRLIVHPEPFDRKTQTDAFGNTETYFSIEQAHMGLTVTSSSRITVEDRRVSTSDKSWEAVATEIRDARDDDWLQAYQYAFPTKRTKPFAELVEYTKLSFTKGRSLFEAAKDLTARINDEFDYDPRATTVSTPIRDVFRSRSGVCQDFAHLQLACLRSMGIPARYVSGYLRTYPPPGKKRLVGADASHAWVSVYCGEAGWIDMDPTNNLIPSTDHITIAWGRDYNDVSPVRGVILGGGTHRLNVSVDVAPLESPEPVDVEQAQQSNNPQDRK